MLMGMQHNAWETLHPPATCFAKCTTPFPLSVQQKCGMCLASLLHSQHMALFQPLCWDPYNLLLSGLPPSCVHTGCPTVQTAAALNRASQPLAVHSDQLHCTLPCRWYWLHAADAEFGGGCLLLCSPHACCAQLHIAGLCNKKQ